MKIIVFLLLATFAFARFTRVEHDYWTTSGRKLAEGNHPYLDSFWNYCDMKCLYFENLVPNTDFFVVNFEGGVGKPGFSSCYGRTGTTGTDKLWNHIYTQENSWYETNCGADTE